MEVGRKLKNLRRDRKLAAKDLAKSCGITAPAISQIENGKSQPRALTLLRIARTLGVPCEYLLDQRLAYPYEPKNWREELRESRVDPKAHRH